LDFCMTFSFFFPAPATTEIYTLSLHDALPIYLEQQGAGTGLPQLQVERLQWLGLYRLLPGRRRRFGNRGWLSLLAGGIGTGSCRSEEHTSELQSRENLVCRLLLEKKKKKANSA